MHVRIQDYGKKEHDKKYSKKDEYKKVGGHMQGGTASLSSIQKYMGC